MRDSSWNVTEVNNECKQSFSWKFVLSFNVDKFTSTNQTRYQSLPALPITARSTNHSRRYQSQPALPVTDSATNHSPPNTRWFWGVNFSTLKDSNQFSGMNLFAFITTSGNFLVKLLSEKCLFLIWTQWQLHVFAMSKLSLHICYVECSYLFIDMFSSIVLFLVIFCSTFCF